MAKSNISQEVKNEIVARAKIGQRICDISRDMGVPYQTVRYTINNADKTNDCAPPDYPSAFETLNKTFPQLCTK